MITMRIYLSVPYAEKEQVKKYGAKWDPEKKLWYSPDERKELIERWGVLSTIESQSFLECDGVEYPELTFNLVITPNHFK